MKTLILVRHAKSSWEHDVDDKLRPLNNRGFSDAKLVANQFKAVAQLPDIIYSSRAKRAHTTCSIFVETLSFLTPNVLTTDELYDFEGEKTLQFIKSINNKFNRVMIFGHNHAFTAISNALGSLSIDNVPTSGLVSITFNSNSWDSLKEGKTTLTLFPKHLR